jgi:hypothetical protein
MPSTIIFYFFVGGSTWGSNWEFDNFTISSKSIAIELGISHKISLGSTSITLRILGRTLGIAKKELGFWSFGDVFPPIGLTLDFGDSGQALVNGDFGPLAEELYDLGNRLQSNTRHNDMVRVGFLDN